MQGTGLSPTQFGVQSNFAGWDFKNVWTMYDANGDGVFDFPELKVFIK